MSYPEKRGRHTTGMWYGELRHPKAGRFRKRFKTKELADAYEAHIRAHGAEPDWAKPDTIYAKDSLKTVADNFKALGGPNGIWAEGRDPSALQRLEWVCDRIGTTPVNLVTRKLVEDRILVPLLAKRGKVPGSKLAAGTINRYLSTLSAVLKYAEDSELVDRTPRLPWRRETKHHQPKYTAEMVKGIISALRTAGHEVDAFMVFLLDRTGMRFSELYEVRAEQIMEDYIDLNDPEQIKNKRCRQVMIGRENANHLRVLVRNKALSSHSTFYMRLADAIKACGYTMSRIVHAFRHTTASRITGETADIQEAADLLGHADLGTTRGYRELPKDVLRARAEKLARERGIEWETTSSPTLISLKKSG